MGIQIYSLDKGYELGLIKSNDEMPANEWKNTPRDFIYECEIFSSFVNCYENEIFGHRIFYIYNDFEQDLIKKQNAWFREKVFEILDRCHIDTWE